MTKFHNPYHFVPVSDEAPPDTVPLADLGSDSGASAAPHVTHDRFVATSMSGRIACRLTVETPLVCGNEQERRQGWTKLVKPFELEPGVPAVPGSALRGMLSSLVEAASQSALRILEDRSLSYRRPVGQGLSAIGMIVIWEGKYHVFPLAEPHRDHAAPGNKLPEGDDAEYGLMFPGPRPKVYFGEAGAIGTDSFLSLFKTFDKAANGPFYGLQCGDRLPDKVKHAKQRSFWLGKQLPSAIVGDTAALRPWNDLSDEEKASGEWTRGVLRVLGKYDSRRDSLPTKKHEFFLPFTEADEADINAGKRLFPLSLLALQRFEQLADERAQLANDDDAPADKLLPFTPHGMRRERPTQSKRPSSSWRLKAGDIVFLRPAPNGRTVVEIALSSIWRGRVECIEDGKVAAASVHRFFPAGKRPLAQGRAFLTLAEQLFGVVEVNPRSEQERQQGTFALASRVRVSHGVLRPDDSQEPYVFATNLWSQAQRNLVTQRTVQDVPLKNLASPKPPSPAMYFRRRNGAAGFIEKRKLAPADHAPQGRKFYLRRDSATYAPDQSAFVHPGRLTDAAQRAAIARQHQSVDKLVRPGAEFVFHLDFDNLSDLELALLLFALEPDGGFRHQLGHGKPLGLGQVRIEVSGIFEVDRRQRYSTDGLDHRRWHRSWVNEALATELDDACAADRCEARAPLKPELSRRRKVLEEWAAQRGIGATLRALELVGRPVPAGVPVHYPQVDGTAAEGAALERECFRWFVANDDLSHGRTRGQFLAPLVNEAGAVAGAIPRLERVKSDDPPPTVYAVPAAGPAGGVAPEDLVGRTLEARAGRPDNQRVVPFTLIVDGEEFDGPKGYVDLDRYTRPAFAQRHPEGTTVRVKVVRLQFGKFVVQPV